MTGCTEVFEVHFLPGKRRPTIVNLEREESRQSFPGPDFAYWIRPSSLIADYTDPVNFRNYSIENILHLNKTTDFSKPNAARRGFGKRHTVKQ